MAVGNFILLTAEAATAAKPVLNTGKTSGTTAIRTAVNKAPAAASRNRLLGCTVSPRYFVAIAERIVKETAPARAYKGSEGFIVLRTARISNRHKIQQWGQFVPTPLN